MAGDLKLEILFGDAVYVLRSPACGDCRVPRCRFCDQPGKRAGGRKDRAGRTVERYYVCNTEGCLAAKMKTPQPMALFSGGK